MSKHSANTGVGIANAIAAAANQRFNGQSITTMQRPSVRAIRPASAAIALVPRSPGMVDLSPGLKVRATGSDPLNESRGARSSVLDALAAETGVDPGIILSQLQIGSRPYMVLSRDPANILWYVSAHTSDGTAISLMVPGAHGLSGDGLSATVTASGVDTPGGFVMPAYLKFTAEDEFELYAPPHLEFSWSGTDVEDPDYTFGVRGLDIIEHRTKQAGQHVLSLGVALSGLSFTTTIPAGGGLVSIQSMAAGRGW